MRFKGVIPGQSDPLFYNFNVGPAELRILFDLLTEAKLKTPKTQMTQEFSNRIEDMRRAMSKAMTHPETVGLLPTVIMTTKHAESIGLKDRAVALVTTIDMEEMPTSKL